MVASKPGQKDAVAKAKPDEALAPSQSTRIGLFADLATRGAATLPELASRTGLDECYVGEWLRAMVGAGRLVNDAHTRMFALAAGMATPGGAAAPPRLSAQVS